MELMTAEEVCLFLKITPRALLALIANAGFPFVDMTSTPANPAARRGRRIRRYRKESVEAWLENRNRAVPVSEPETPEIVVPPPRRAAGAAKRTLR